MKLLTLILAMTLSFSTNAKEKSKVYHSFDADYQARIIVSPAKDKQHYYINFVGFEHEYDNKTMLFKKVPNDLRNGYNFKLAGSERTNLVDQGYQTFIHGTAVSYQTVLLSGDKNTKVIYSGEADINKVRRIEAQYQALQGLAISKVAAKKLIKTANQQLSSHCKQDYQLNIDWPAFNKAQQKTTPGMLASYLLALGRICQIDEDYLAAVQEIDTIEVKLSKDKGKQDIKLQANRLLIAFDNETPNVFETSYNAILDTL